MPVWLLLIPGILGVLEKVVGTIEPGVKDSISNSLLGSPLSGGSIISTVMSVVSGCMSGLTSVQKANLKIELQTLLGALDVQKTDAVSTRFYQYGARLTLEWGLIITVLAYKLVIPMTSWICALLGIILPAAPSLDPLSVGLLTGLLGIHIVSNSWEKIAG